MKVKKVFHGFVAQDVFDSLNMSGSNNTAMVSHDDENKNWNLNMMQIIPSMVLYIQELKKRIEVLERI